ncbi:hypothetical protein [Luteolibacter sp. LG18]|uniref:hypothetical protein n=1 Tax=Luteolibacter sp. LG18 TaxID=2819286 RepID=UPI002B31F0F2|nr:hypothetical protein llg_13270 [Luteolibacter sp. LG18]
MDTEPLDRSGRTVSVERKSFRWAIAGCLLILLGGASFLFGQLWGMDLIHRMTTSKLGLVEYSAELNRISRMCGPFIWGGLIAGGMGALVFLISFIMWLAAVLDRRSGNPPQ